MPLDQQPLDPDGPAAAAASPASEAPQAAPPPASDTPDAPARDPEADALLTLQRIERLLRDIRGALDGAAHESAHRHYSLARLIGAILEVIVVGLVALAVLDWLLQAPPASLLTKLAFAAVLQLSALTALLVARDE